MCKALNPDVNGIGKYFNVETRFLHKLLVRKRA
jgi:hypothetical protein